MKNIFITGGNRGIGKGLVEAFSRNNNVYFTVRDKSIGDATLKSIKTENIDFVTMDVGDSNSVKRGVDNLKRKTDDIDILINNAGILIPGLKYKIDALETDDESILKTFNINTLGVLRVCKHIIPIMPTRSRIINISSGMGQMEGMGIGSLAYRLSKSALNALTIILSKELVQKEISINAICPGWVRTDMGGEEATLTIKESADSILKFALAENFPNGDFLRDGEKLPW